MHFGPSSEKYDRDLQQLELRLEDLEANQAAAEPPPAVPATVACKQTALLKPARRPLPAELPREIEIDCAGSGSVSRLWRCVAPVGRGRSGEAGICSGAIQSNPHGATETELCGLLADRTGAGAEPAD